MDILISSNLERFIFDIYANDGQKVEKLYKKLQENKVFNLDHTQLKNMQSLFYGNFASEKDTFTAIKSAFDKYRYVLDPHTAVGWHVLQKYRMETSDPTPVILTATASPFKFPVAVLDAITGKRLANEYEALYKLADICGMPVHKNLDGIDKRSICHNRVIDKDQIVSFIDNESKRF